MHHCVTTIQLTLFDPRSILPGSRNLLIFKLPHATISRLIRLAHRMICHVFRYWLDCLLLTHHVTKFWLTQIDPRELLHAVKWWHN